MSECLAFRSPNWLGDAVMATVVPTAIRRRYPDARLEVVVPRAIAEVFDGHPGVDRVIPFDAGHEVDAYRHGRYDRLLLGPTSFGSAWRAFQGRAAKRYGFGGNGRAVLLSGSLPGAAYRRDRHQVENYRELAGLLGTPENTDEPLVRPGAEARVRAAELWPQRGGLRVVLQPGATYGPAKRWAAERFAQVGRAFLEEGADVAVVGGAGDRAEIERTLAAASGLKDLGGRTTVGELAAVLEGADLVITNDSGPMHLAAAVGTRTVAVFGSTSPTWTRPRGAGHQVVTHAVPCAPCFRRDCRIGYGCLTGVTVDHVLAQARVALAHEVTP